MGTSFFFASAVCAGFVLIGLVAYAILRPKPEHRPSVTGLLGLLGFALVAGPNWTSISIRGEGLELSLLREMQARQLQVLTELEERGCPKLAQGPDGGQPASAARAPDAPEERAPKRPELSAADPAAAGAGARPAAPAPLSLERAQRLIDAFDRGDLELRGLSTRELLALNERLSERERASLRR